METVEPVAQVADLSLNRESIRKRRDESDSMREALKAEEVAPRKPLLTGLKEVTAIYTLTDDTGRLLLGRLCKRIGRALPTQAASRQLMGSTSFPTNIWDARCSIGSAAKRDQRVSARPACVMPVAASPTLDKCDPLVLQALLQDAYLQNHMDVNYAKIILSEL